MEANFHGRSLAHGVGLLIRVEVASRTIIVCGYHSEVEVLCLDEKSANLANICGTLFAVNSIGDHTK